VEDRNLLLRRKTVHLAGLVYILIIFSSSQVYGFYFASLAMATIVMFTLAFYTGYELLRLRGYTVGFLAGLWKMLGSPESVTVPEYWGACWFGLSMCFSSALSVLTGYPEIFYIAACAAVLGDGFSGLTGFFIGKTSFPFNPVKTIEGFLAGFFATLIGSWLLTGCFTLSLLGALSGSAVELYPSRLPDNLTIPLTVTAVVAITVLGGIC
jgi:dolichol kinase